MAKQTFFFIQDDLECSYFLINRPKEANKLIRVELQYGSCIHANIICMFFCVCKNKFFYALTFVHLCVCGTIKSGFVCVSGDVLCNGS